MNYKNEFPIFEHHKNLIYLDSAATNQKPRKVIEAMSEYNLKYNASPNRASYKLSLDATSKYNSVREKTSKFVGVNKSEIIFTKSATEAFNLLASSWSKKLSGEDTILLGISNHHSNIVPWQIISKELNLNLKYIYLDAKGEFDYLDLESKLDDSVKLISISHGVNATGLVHNLEKLIKKVKKLSSAKIIVDICQSIAHEDINFKNLGIDMGVFSAHKMFGPVGIGVLYIKEDLINNLEPFLYGGDMIEFVNEQESTFKKNYEKFEGGTQNVEGAIGLGAAIDFIKEIGMDNIKKIENALVEYAIKKMSQLDFIELYHYENSLRGPIISFNVNGVHPHDVAQVFDSENIAIRTGNHCTQPLLKYLGIFASCRISFSIFNKKEEIDKVIVALYKVKKIFLD